MKHILLFARLPALCLAGLLLAAITNAQTYQWALNIEGAGGDQAYDIITDASGNVYVTGYFELTADFDPSVNTAYLTSNGGLDIFVAKYDSVSNYLWAFNVGGTDNDEGYGIVADDSGDIYLTGSFEGTADFDPSANTANLTSPNGPDADAFIAKYDTDGNYLWAFNVGGASADYGAGIAIDPTGSGAVYVTGQFQLTVDFDPSGNIANLTPNGVYDGFVAKYDTDGSYLWAFNVGGTGSDFGQHINIDTSGSGDVYLTGYFQDTADFDPSANTANLISNGNTDVYVAKYDANGNYLWAFW